MSYVYVSVYFDQDGNLFSDISIKAQDILQTMRWYYQLQRRFIIREIVKNYFEKNHVKDYLKQYIEKELKSKYYDDNNIEIKSMQVTNVEFKDELVIVTYKLTLQNKKKQKQNYTS